MPDNFQVGEKKAFLILFNKITLETELFSQPDLRLLTGYRKLNSVAREQFPQRISETVLTVSNLFLRIVYVI